MQRVIFVTGTDTGVGKTVLSCLLARRLWVRGQSVGAYKPLCSGGRDDALALQAALDGLPELEAINPWHFPAPIAPLLAARRAGRVVRMGDVVKGARCLLLQSNLLVMEGAGGLLSPLGEDFDARDLIRALHASPVIVCPNRLGSVNQVRLVWEALPKAAQKCAQVVLFDPAQPDSATPSNAALLAEYLGRERIHKLPWLAGPDVPASRALMRRLDALLAALGLPSCSG
jgi:dethiobiotin synthetase